MHRTIEIVEAGYALQLSDDVWLRGVLGAALRAGAWDRGIIGFHVEARPSSERVMSPPIMIDTHLEVASERAWARLLGPPDQDVSVEHGGALGWDDTFVVRALDRSGAGMVFAGLSSRPIPRAPRRDRTWRCVATHLGAALRLRGAARSLPVRHSNEGTGSPCCRESLRAAALSVVRLRSASQGESSGGAVALWEALVTGRWTLVDRFVADGRHHVLARRNTPETPDPRGLSGRERSVADRLALGHSYKQIAYGLGLRDGTVAALAARARARLRARTHAELAGHLIGPGSEPAVTAPLTVGGEMLHVLSWARSGWTRLLDGLSVSERDIAAALTSGQTNGQIAHARGTSSRTVANQVASVFRKLGVSSRAELISKGHGGGGKGGGCLAEPDPENGVTRLSTGR